MTGLFYFLFCWSLDFGDTSKGLFAGVMLFLPGITFPLTTSYYKLSNPNSILQPFIHFVLSVGIYHGSVWLFSGEGRIKFITILAGFLGSLLFLLATKYLLKKRITLVQIAVTATLSGLAFLPYEWITRSEFLMGFAVFWWTVVNGFLLNLEYKKSSFH
ncbi:hypothetical protein KFE98_10535 [bacterium SCSIO 12741]|nr:hypothetical protein KFE98_10535 [bacterium SCSIO 12741]